MFNAKAGFLFLMMLAVSLASCGKKNPEIVTNPTNGQSTAVFAPGLPYESITDEDGNTYKTIKIGTQTWMAENLRTRKFNDGKTIPLKTASDIINAFDAAYTSYDNKEDFAFIATYGRHYNGYAIKTGKIAPKGWHVPTQAEWETLIAFLGGSAKAGGKMKETGLLHWGTADISNVGATNTSGFTALGAGISGAATGKGSQNLMLQTYFASSTVTGEGNLFFVTIKSESETVESSSIDESYPISVRCIKD